MRVTQDVLDALDVKARSLDMTRSAATRAALQEWTHRDGQPAAHFDVVAASKGEPAWADHRHRRTTEPVSSEFVAGRRVEKFGCQEPGCKVTFE